MPVVNACDARSLPLAASQSLSPPSWPTEATESPFGLHARALTQPACRFPERTARPGAPASIRRDQHPAFVAAPGKAAAVGAPRHRGRRRRRAGHRPRGTTDLAVPDEDTRVAGPGQATAVGVPGHRSDGAGLLALDVQQAIVLHVPDPDGPVVAAGGEPAAVAAPGEGVHGALVKGDRLGRPAAFDVPDQDDPILAGGGEATAVGAPRRRENRPGVAFERAPLLVAQAAEERPLPAAAVDLARAGRSSSSRRSRPAMSAACQDCQGAGTARRRGGRSTPRGRRRGSPGRC